MTVLKITSAVISLTNADNQITGIAVNKKAVTYLKNTVS